MYLDYYATELESSRLKPVVIVEVGVYRGHFLETLAAYFPHAKIIGIEIQVDRVRAKNPRLVVEQGDQGDARRIEEILDRHAPNGIDILFDDASHTAMLTKKLYDAVMPRLKSGGLYYIEDWGTGYLDNWHDGREFSPARIVDDRVQSHDFGMVGFVKSLIDETRGPYTDARGNPRRNRLASISIWTGVAKLVKA